MSACHERSTGEITFSFSLRNCKLWSKVGFEWWPKISLFNTILRFRHQQLRQSLKSPAIYLVSSKTEWNMLLHHLAKQPWYIVPRFSRPILRKHGDCYFLKSFWWQSWKWVCLIVRKTENQNFCPRNQSTRNNKWVGIQEVVPASGWVCIVTFWLRQHWGYSTSKPFGVSLKTEGFLQHVCSAHKVVSWIVCSEPFV